MNLKITKQIERKQRAYDRSHSPRCITKASENLLDAVTQKHIIKDNEIKAFKQ